MTPEPATDDLGTLSFPRLKARTASFTLGAPRGFAVVAEGRRVLFLRSGGPTDRAGALWALDVGTDDGTDDAGTDDAGTERLVADPAVLLADGDEQLSQAERARRERARETGAGIVAFGVDGSGDLAAFALSSRLWVATTAPGAANTVRELPAAAPVVDPRPDPTGRLVAYASAGALRVSAVDGSGDRALVEPDGEDVSWGVAEFVAAEEMGRFRGYWWAPDGSSLLVARVDESPVQTWHIADPAEPGAAPVPVRYPAAGTDNAVVSLWHVALDGRRREVRWDRSALPYLVAVQWDRGDGLGHSRGPLLLVMSRDQRHEQVLEISLDGDEPAATAVAEQRDDDWLEVVDGVPAWGPGGRLVMTADDAATDTRRVTVDGSPLSPPGLQVAAVLGVGADGVLVSATDEPTESHVHRVGWDGGVERLTPAGAVASGAGAAATTVLVSATLAEPGATATVLRAGRPVHTVASRAARPPMSPRVELLRLGERQLRSALVLPRDRAPGDGPLPVLVDPYGGPHGRQVATAHNGYLERQWFADAGFAVLVVDNRGMPLRGPSWERAVSRDFPTPVLEDQVAALHALDELRPGLLDLGRVGIRGWSFGGWLAALAVLRRPDVFSVAVSGAPVTDWTLYDTFYTERYLGRPQEEPDAYRRCSLLEDAPKLERPLLLIHGLSDDNVVVANTLRLSSALLAAGRPHTVLPLTGVTHMTPQEVVAENLLLLQLEFLQRHLAA